MGEHWYLRTGEPFYETEKRGGGLRAVTIADARKIGAVPSVTTVLSVIAKPALENWKVDQGIMAALTLPRVPGESEADWLKRIKEDSKQQAIKAAEEGTRIHDACEMAFKNQAFPEFYRPHVAAVQAEVRRMFPGVDDWRAEDYFAAHGYGGKVDLHSPSTGIVIDYKGKDGDFSDGKKLAYDQNWQLAAYQHGLGLKPNVCVNIFVSRTHPGKVASHVWQPDELADGLRVFQAAHQLWKAMRGYDPMAWEAT
jgi:hypothetical protein